MEAEGLLGVCSKKDISNLHKMCSDRVWDVLAVIESLGLEISKSRPCLQIV